MVSSLITLNNGIKIPLIGLGCWKIPNDVCASTVYEAIKIGYRLFDGACDYGNEKEVGQGIKKAIDEGVVKREDLTIVSKLWNNYHDPKNVKKALLKTLNDLNLSYLDVYYIHFPISFKFVPFEEKYPPGFYCGNENGDFEFENIPVLDTWRALENLVDQGLIKSLGISNFTGVLIEDLIKSACIKPALLQIEHHPYLVQQRLIEYCKVYNIKVVGYSSFGPQSFLELNVKKAVDSPSLFNHDTIIQISNKHRKLAGQILLRWATQRGVAIIPKSVKKERLIENLNTEEFNLTEEELNLISNLDQNLRFNDPWEWSTKPNPKMGIFI
ncbi:trifunctional aldehyde reductase/xylose reductase/glucose 1-dehydrogenase (NADP(+)) [Ascoidea rubescens DSM 1968]|uniref:Aldose reductase n=1 Tax=Ascoidea rubescens DSM 1968 TaxID=1344418 RepID=A0A1D2VNR9_9ASCO|nr:aldose reductase [Ascoidea rubescens DSM 1968]ODV63239.1 aldose reductase [Ascoidea rubescens DSM 1968]